MRTSTGSRSAALACTLLIGCAPGAGPLVSDGAPLVDAARPDAALDAGRDAPTRDAGPLPDGYIWTSCEEYVAAGGSGADEPCDPRTFGSCEAPSSGCAIILECDDTTRRITHAAIC